MQENPGRQTEKFFQVKKLLNKDLVSKPLNDFKLEFPAENRKEQNWTNVEWTRPVCNDLFLTQICVFMSCFFLNHALLNVQNCAQCALKKVLKTAHCARCQLCAVIHLLDVQQLKNWWRRRRGEKVILLPNKKDDALSNVQRKSWAAWSNIKLLLVQSWAVQMYWIEPNMLRTRRRAALVP